LREGLRPLRAVLRRALLLSSVLALAVMGGFFVLFSYDLEDVLFNRMVAAEADRQAQALASGQTPVQPAVGMSVHRGHAALPAALARELSPLLGHGEYEVAAGEAGHFHVAVRPRVASGDTLYVAFRANAFTRTTSRLLRRGGLLASSAALALLAAAVIASRAARRLSGPLEGLRHSLQSEGAALPGEDGAVAEVHALLEALRARDARIQALLERERRFNRDASHELRTPLAVAQGAVEILERHPPRDRETFARLRDAVHQMGLLTEGILWLARERRTGEVCELTSVSREVVALYDGLRSPEVAVVVEAEGAVHAPVPASVARVLLGNLVKNAFSYTRAGQVRVRVEAGCWSVSDSGEGLGAVAPERSGFGVGLSLVERLAQHFGWRVLLTPLSPHGTRAELRWPERHSER
jgi:signal transduction histidine kinase